MSHVHHCATCGEPVRCSGSRVDAGDGMPPYHCERQEDGPIYCRACGYEQDEQAYRFKWSAADYQADDADHRNKEAKETEA